MTNKDIAKIYFQGNEIVALYQGSTLIFKKSGSVVPPSPKPTGTYIVRGTLKPDSREQNIQLCVNGKREQFDVNDDKTFEYTFTNVPVTNMDYFTLACKDDLKTIDLANLDTSQVTSMIEAFFQCSNLRSIDLTNIDTSKVTNMYRMFYFCINLTSLDVSKFDTSKVTNMDGMFQTCANLTSLDVSNFDTSNVTNMGNMFNNCGRLESLDLSSFDTSNVRGMSGMFGGCDSLKTLDLSSFDTSKVIDMHDMFYNCYYDGGLTSLDLSNFDTSNVTDMGGMFNYGNSYSDSYSQGLTSLDISNFNTSNVTRMNDMFANHRELADLYINFDVRSIKDDNYNYNGIFYGCLSLENVVGKFEGAKTYLVLSDCPLTVQSAMVFINGLATITTKRTLYLSAKTYDSLTPEQIAIATSKGWTVTRR